MTKQEWEIASEEERDAEIKRCHNPVYLYNNYFRKPEMPFLSEEEFYGNIAVSRMTRCRFGKPISMDEFNDIKEGIKDYFMPR